jgi:hypothetical protein
MEKGYRPISPPPATPTPLKAYQMEMRVGCSARVKYIEVINMKAGSAIASNAPDKMRRESRPAKFLAAACAINRAPHMKMLKAK